MSSSASSEETTISKFGKSFASGFISSAVGKYVSHPLDTIKMRIQISGTKQPLNYHFTNIITNEGFGGFFKGAVSPVLGTAPIMATLFASNDFAKRNLAQTQLPVFWKEFLPGCWAGFSTLLFVIPTDLIKIKKQGVHNRVVSYSEVLKTILEIDGILGLYRGFWISFIRFVPQYGIHFYSYEKLKQAFGTSATCPPSTSTSPMYINFTKMISGGVAGQICCLIGYPVDVVRTYILYHPEHRSITKTIMYLYQNYGVGYFHRGWSVAMGKSFVNGAVTFSLYEVINAYLLSE